MAGAKKRRPQPRTWAGRQQRREHRDQQHMRRHGHQPAPIAPPAYMDGWPRRVKTRGTLTSAQATAWAKKQPWYHAVVHRGLTARYYYWILDPDLVEREDSP